jgi:hypothetical protein
MASKAASRRATAGGKSPFVVVVFISLAVALVIVSTRAKTSRYDLHAKPSRHFSSSVKIARLIPLDFLGAEAAAVPGVPQQLPVPVLSGWAESVQPMEARVAVSRFPFPPLRAPPLLS